MRSIVALLTILTLAGSIAGCFTYVAAPEMPAKGTPVRAHLNRPVPVELPNVTARDIVEVQGEFVTADPDQLVLSAFSIESNSDFRYRTEGATVHLPRDAIGLLEERRVSPQRTALATVALLGAGYLIQLGLRSAFGGGEGDGGTPPPK